MAAQPTANDVQSFLDMTGQTNRQEAILRLKVIDIFPIKQFESTELT